MTFRHGFPHSPTALAYDSVQKLLVIGDKSGSLRILGRPGVDLHVRHEGDSACAVITIEFLVNEGALVTATADDTLHLWNFRQKFPQVVQSLKFQRERITCIHLPIGSKWLYVGTEKGNIHVVHIETFALSGYVINWNKAIEVTRTTHPGAVVGLCDNPLDANKLLIAFESGQIVLWDMRGKTAEMRWHSAEPLRSIAWHHEGKHFVSSHTDGSLCTWPLRPSPKPQFHSFPHAKPNKDGKVEACKPIHKVDLRTARSGDTFTIFSGGLSMEKGGKSPCITVLNGRSTTVLEMEHPVVDFVTMCETPWPSDMQEPYAIAVLLQNDLVIIDLLTPGFPCFESPYPMDLHESPVTCCTYLADCQSDLVPAFYSVGRTSTSRKTGFSDREWPVSGGEWSPASCSYSEIVITGHQDGSVKFWDASAGSLQVLYKLRTGKLFERPRARSVDSSDEDPLAVHIVCLCAETRRLCIAGASGHVILFKFKKTESSSEILVLEIPISYESFEEGDVSPECEFVPRAAPKVPDAIDNEKKNDGMLKVRPGPQRKPPGFQAQLVCLTPWTTGSHPGQITSLSINSSYGLMAYGNEYGIAVVDIIQKVCLLNVASPDLYGAQDPYSRVPKSPKRSDNNKDEQARSPSIDQDSSVSDDSQNCLKLLFGNNFCDKLDSSFSRSRSSSMSSLENISSEAVTCLAFSDSYTKKSDPSLLTPTLWVGTSLGSVLTVSISLPDADCRNAQPVLVSILGGPIFRLKGSILAMSFLDCNGALIPYTSDPWKEEVKRDRTPTKNPNRMSPTLGASGAPSGLATSTACGSDNSSGDRQFIVIASEKQARVVALPSQNCVYRLQITETDFVVKAEIVSMRESVCLAAYLSNGHIMAFSLPSLRPLLDCDFLPLIDLSFQTKCKQGIVDPMLSIWGQQLIVHEDTNQISKTFCFSNKGHGLYLATPTEIQKFTICSEFCQFYNDNMMGELFAAHEMPEPPKESFFKGLFGGGIRSLDREELFGDLAGKANRSVAKHIPGSNLEQLGQRASTATSEISRAHQLAMERGEKLNLLEERAERMSSAAQDFSGTAHSLMLKYKDKKWYQL
ncbi:syntaxin-binding protein 5 isoform X6 [Condylostylus longicornis]|uniref:syntaxin-binding protein 5 isoform X6 n=1 Tax=Condylostylus longicornis TaxID=2530218 RepID=UPI00244DAC6B|nr:syntaxin-binding protein 5 isoform X6 [Condylostylus longicornis]